MGLLSSRLVDRCISGRHKTRVSVLTWQSGGTEIHDAAIVAYYKENNVYLCERSTYLQYMKLYVKV